MVALKVDAQTFRPAEANDRVAGSPDLGGLMRSVGPPRECLYSQNVLRPCPEHTIALVSSGTWSGSSRQKSPVTGLTDRDAVVQEPAEFTALGEYGRGGQKDENDKVKCSAENKHRPASTL